MGRRVHERLLERATSGPKPTFSPSRVHWVVTWLLTWSTRFGLCESDRAAAMWSAQALETFESAASYWKAAGSPLSARDWFVALNSALSSEALWADAMGDVRPNEREDGGQQQD